MSTSNKEPPDAVQRHLHQETLHLLEQLKTLLGRLEPDVYDRPASPQIGSIGAHVRHALDHVEALVTARQASRVGEGRVDYQARRRDTDAEHCPQAGLARLDRLAEMTRAAATVTSASAPIVAQLVGDGPDARQVELPSSWEREWAFVYSHTLHHMAMISILADSYGVSTPDDFGVAPSTLRYRRGDIDPPPNAA